jgi:amino acid adenylation domain-containing protein
VPVVLPRIPEALAAFIGVLYSANFYVPLDCATPALRLKKILSSLNAKNIITSREFSDLIDELNLEEVNVIWLEDHLAQGDANVRDDYRWIDTIDTDPAYCIFTSGSTGEPKGVVISHGSVQNFASWARDYFALDSAVVTGNQASFYFDASVMDIYNCIFSGVKIELIPQQFFSFPARLLSWIAERNINFVFWVPSVLVNVANSKLLERETPDSLKRILFIGEAMPTPQLQHWLANHSDAKYYNLYGPTEATCAVSCYKVPNAFDADKPLPIGEPCDNTKFYIQKADGEIAGEEEIGELCITGNQLALGYWNSRASTQEHFVTSAVGAPYFERMYKTGDLAYLDIKGEIIFVGRQDSQIKHLGYRIELGDIESSCLSLDGVMTACVLYDNEQQRIILFYTSDNGFSERNVRASLRALLPRYMQPRSIEQIEEMPLNRNGKIDRTKLREQIRK